MGLVCLNSIMVKSDEYSYSFQIYLARNTMAKHLGYTYTVQDIVVVGSNLLLKTSLLYFLLLVKYLLDDIVRSLDY